MAALDGSLLPRKVDFETGIPPDSIRHVQEAIRQTNDLLMLFPHSERPCTDLDILALGGHRV